MDTVDFFKKVLPSSGLKILAELVPYKHPKTGEMLEGWRYKTFQSFEAMAEATKQFDGQNRTVYHACNAYNDWYFDEKKQKKRIRTATNVVGCRSLYDDIDVGKVDAEGKPKGYQTRAEAMVVVRKIVSEGALPSPLVVYSGGGIHLYWPLTADVTPDEWMRLAVLKRRITMHYGLMADRAVDLDLARVLRPVGSRNHKYKDKPEVIAKNDVKPYDAAALTAKMEKFIEANKVERVTVSTPSTKANAFAALEENNYEPSDADRVAEHCAVIKWFKETGAPDEPMWFLAQGCVKHMIDGEAVVHDWSSQYDKYDEAETQIKLDTWERGPTTCAAFQKQDDSMCKGCVQNGKIKSPIQLGYGVRTEAAPSIVAPEVVVTPAEVKVLTREQAIQRAWPEGFREDEGKLKAYITNDDGVVTPLTLSATLFWATGWVQSEDGTWELGVCVRARNGKHRDFTIPAAAMGSADKLTSALAAYGVFLESPKLGGWALKYMKDFYHNLSYLGAEVASVSAFGWSKEMDSFVIGTRRHFADRIEEVHVTEDIMSSGYGEDFGIEGDRKTWVDTVDYIYNRPGAEVYQYLFLVAASAPLIKLAGIPDFHGIPTALTGESGLGKTTTCKIACSVWGNPEKFKQPSDSAGTTAQAMVKRVSLLRNVPTIFDEMTGQKLEILRDLLFALSNGKDKSRLNSSGKFASGGMEWDLPSFITGNMDMTGMLNNLDQQQKDAAMVRVMEIKLPKDFNENLWKGELNEVKRLIAEVLPNTYGHVGHELLQFYITKKDEIREKIFKTRNRFDVSDRETMRERFYIDNLAVALVAGAAMKKLGIVNFDLKAIEQAMLRVIKSLRAARRATAYNDEEYIGQFLSWLYGKMIITKSVANLRSGDPIEAPMEQPKVGAPMARLATGDKRFIVTAKALNDWAKEFGGASATTVRDWMDKHGYILHIMGREESGAWMFRIGQGTHVSTGLSRCYELDYSKVYGSISNATSNVVTMASAAPASMKAHEVAA